MINSTIMTILGKLAGWTGVLILFSLIVLGMAGCTLLGFNYASLEIDDTPSAIPEISAEFDRSAARTLLETELYGPWPANLAVSASRPRMIDADYLDGLGTLEEIEVTIGNGQGSRIFPVVLALPKGAADKPVPILVSQTFADNCSVFPDSALTAPDGTTCDGSRMTGTVGFLATQIFGRYIAYAPTDRYLSAGIGYASFGGASVVPDRNGRAQEVMAQLGTDPAPTSALMLWAYAYAKVAEVLASDSRIRPNAIAALGHSRYGKSALIATGWSDTVSAAISHQSGFAGAASSHSRVGERLDRMAKSYPHWVRPGLGEELAAGLELKSDQHLLLALSAPKPIFLGNARRDVWSDPNSTFRMAMAADAAYERAGVPGLQQDQMRAFLPAAEISYWLRTGGHSVISRDVDAFIAFMTAHFETD